MRGQGSAFQDEPRIRHEYDIPYPEAIIDNTKIPLFKTLSIRGTLQTGRTTHAQPSHSYASTPPDSAEPRGNGPSSPESRTNTLCPCILHFNTMRRSTPTKTWDRKKRQTAPEVVGKHAANLTRGWFGGLCYTLVLNMSKSNTVVPPKILTRLDPYVYGQLYKTVRPKSGLIGRAPPAKIGPKYHMHGCQPPRVTAANNTNARIFHEPHRVRR